MRHEKQNLHVPLLVIGCGGVDEQSEQGDESKNYCVALVATMLLLNLEKNRFNKQKQEAWGGDSILTPRGQE